MTPKKKGIRIPHMFTLLLLIIAVCTILTYVIPAGQYETYVDENGVEMLVDGSYHRIEQTPVTPMKALMAVQEGLIETAYISAFIFIIGGAFGVVAETKAIEAGIGRIIKKTSKRQELLIPIMIFVVGFGAGSFGMFEECLVFIPFLVPICIAMGYDSITGLAVAIVGSIFAANGTITIGDIQAFIQYVKNFTQPIQQLSQVSNMLQSMAAAAERVFEFLNEPEEDQLADPARRADPACIDGQVTFDHVRFGYVPEKTIIHDFSCKVQPGQKVAIVGPTGAGKTTMVKLLMRFYDVDSGSITLNGHDIRDFDRSALREGFGMVLQDTWLFKGTIMENIRYGRLDATDEEVIAAAKAANADHFIRTLPGGYQMELNEDASNVSQGQKQLLTIARAILADNRILILDEATSSVDTRTEQRIQTAMDNLMRGRTSFVIAHRLSTIRDADLILVMRDGDIVEQGTHDQLIEAGGFYADLYNSQFEDVVD